MAGVVTLSMEVELGWGVHDRGDYSHLSAGGRRERASLARLLDRCDDLDVPISFDVVGHLLLDECDGDHPGGHRDGWFDADPGTDADRDPLFYAPDAVAGIRDRTTDHELCTHTFSHVNCAATPPETLAWELDRVQDLHRERLGGPTTAIVPPRHHPPPADVLRDAGIRVVRTKRRTDTGTRLHRFKELLLGPHPTFEPRVVDGVVETYCTTYPSLVASSLPLGQHDAHPAFAPLPVSLRQRLHRRYLVDAVRTAAETGGHCHLWCHLYDVANEYQWPPLRDFLGILADYRDRGLVEVVPMRDLEDRVDPARGRPDPVGERAESPGAVAGERRD